MSDYCFKKKNIKYKRYVSPYLSRKFERTSLSLKNEKNLNKIELKKYGIFSSNINEENNEKNNLKKNKKNYLLNSKKNSNAASNYFNIKTESNFSQNNTKKKIVKKKINISLININKDNSFKIITNHNSSFEKNFLNSSLNSSKKKKN